MNTQENTATAATLPVELDAWLAEVWPATEPGTPHDPGPLHTLDAQDLVDALDALDHAMFTLKTRIGDVTAVAVELVDRAIVARYSGRVWQAAGDTKRTAWNKARIRDLVEQQRSRILIDPATGEEIRAYPAKELGDLIDVKTGVNVARALGVSDRELANVEWVPAVKVAR